MGGAAPSRPAEGRLRPRARYPRRVRVATAFARPRVGLAGNPSDLAGGRVLAFTFDAFRAQARAWAAEGLVLAVGQGEEVRCGDTEEVAERLSDRSSSARPRGGAALIGAALVALARAKEVPAPRNLAVAFSSDVPRQVGLGGSTAIVVAVLRAVARLLGAELSPARVAEIALTAERDVLGTVAGPMDRVSVAHGGLLHIDCTSTATRAHPTALDAALLPELVLAHEQRPGRPSGLIHAEGALRRARGEADAAALDALADLAERARDALLAGDRDTLWSVLDAHPALRERALGLSRSDRAAIEVGRRAGAATKQCGSGGAWVALPRAPEDLPRVRAAFAEAGYATLIPRVAAGAGAGLGEERVR